jgi:hypothetical protein
MKRIGGAERWDRNPKGKEEKKPGRQVKRAKEK